MMTYIIQTNLRFKINKTPNENAHTPYKANNNVFTLLILVYCFTSSILKLKFRY